MTKAKTRRVYRLRALLAYVGACTTWREFVCGFETAAEVLAAINMAPDKPLPGELVHKDVGRAYWLRWEAYEVANVMHWTMDTDDAIAAARDDAAWWLSRRYCDGRRNDAPITPEEAERFRALWVRYADEHGLYEEVPV